MEDLKIHGAGTYLAVLLSTLGVVVPKTSQLMEQMIFMAQNHLAEVPDEVWMYVRRDDGWRGAQPVQLYALPKYRDGITMKMHLLFRLALCLDIFP